MAQIRLRNDSRSSLRKGGFVKGNPANIKGVLSATYSDMGIIGTVAQNTLPGGLCLINPINTVSWDDIMDKPTTMGTKITFSDTAPINPAIDDTWIEISQT